MSRALPPQTRPAPNRPIRLIIADEQPVARAGTKAALRDTDIRVVGEASTDQQAIELVGKRRPDVVLMEVRFEKGNGLQALSRLKLEFPDLLVRNFTSMDCPAHTARSVDLGVAGESIWTRSELRRMTGALTTPRPGREIDEPLSAREIEIVQRLAAGGKNKQIAEGLEINIETVKEHMQHIFEKLHMNTRLHVALRALRAGLV